MFLSYDNCVRHATYLPAVITMNHDNRFVRPARRGQTAEHTTDHFIRVSYRRIVPLPPLSS